MSIMGAVMLVLVCLALIVMIVGGCILAAQYAPDESAPRPQDPRPPQAPGPRPQRVA